MKLIKKILEVIEKDEFLLWNFIAFFNVFIILPYLLFRYLKNEINEYRKTKNKNQKKRK